MNLKQALRINLTAVTPGAVNGNGYVYIEDEDEDRPYRYVADMNSSKIETWSLTYEQLDRLVVGAKSQNWTPVSNFIF
jgi:hypothetical protein